MEKVSEFLNLSTQTISIYNECLGKGLLTYGEIKSFTPDIDDDDLIEILDNLISEKLLIKFVPEHLINLTHYLAILPFSIIITGTSQIKNFFTSKDVNLIENIENNIKSIFSEGQKIGINQINKDFKAFEKELKDGILKLNKEVEKLKGSKDKIDDSLDFLSKYEEELKKIIESELASILVVILQLKTELREKVNEAGVTDKQWDMILNSIKEFISSKVNDKAKEIKTIISDEYKEINDILIDKVKPSDVIQLELKSTNLEILKYVQGKVSKIQSEIQAKEKIINGNLEKLENNLNSSVIDVIQVISKHILKNIDFIEDFLQIILTEHSEINQFSLENLWPINNIVKIQEEISILLENSKENVTIIVPNIPDYIPFEKFANLPESLKIKVVSSESHNSEIIKNILKTYNIEYNRLKNKNLIGINSDDSNVIIGIKQGSQSNTLKNIIGFGTNYKPLIDVINTIFSEKLLLAKPRKETRITNQFNMIIENINDFKGSKISRILQEILDVAVKMEGISLNVLDIKLLISKLKTIEKPLNDEMKQGVIDKIIILNPIFSKLELIQVPKFRAPKLKKITPKTKREPAQADISFKKRELSDIERLNASFEIFLENIDEFKGVDLGNHIETIIDLTLTSQGFSQIVEWRHGLKLIDSHLEDAFKEKLRDDVDKWHNDLLSVKGQAETPKTEKTRKIGTSAPSLTQLKDRSQPKIESKTEDDTTIDGGFNDISQNLNSLTGLEISKKLQDIMDIILETIGYSMDLKDMKQWNSKLRRFRKPIDEEMKSEFLPDFNKWRTKFSKQKSKDDTEVIDFTPSFVTAEQDPNENTEGSSKSGGDNDLKGSFDDLIQGVDNLKGVELNKKLLNIADIILETQGYSMALKEIREWSKKLSTKRATLEEEMIIEFKQDLEKWKNKFC